MKPIYLIIITAVLIVMIAPFTNGFTTAHASDSSTIAGINVGTLSEEEIRAALQNAVNNWSQNPPTIEGGGSIMTIDPTAIQFNIDATISTYNALTEKPWYAFWESKKTVHIPIEVTNGEMLKANIDAMGNWNVDETYALAIQNISNLVSEPIAAIVVDSTILEAERLTFIIQDIPENAKAVYDMAMFLDGTVIGAGENFSLLQTLSSLADNSNVEGLSFLGSLLYRNALHTNTMITERHPQQMIPTYLEPGLEAYVNVKTEKDISFTNNSGEPMKMMFSVSGQQLKVEFTSSVNAHTVTVNVNPGNEVEPRQIVRFTNDLAVGAQRVMQKGEKGARITVFRAIDGFEEQVSRDYYPPTNEIILKSSRQPVEVPATDNNNAPTGNTTDSTANDGTIPSQTPNDSEDPIDLDNDGLPDINQGEGYEPDVDDNGNVVQPDNTTTDKSGETVTKGGGSE